MAPGTPTTFTWCGSLRAVTDTVTVRPDTIGLEKKSSAWSRQEAWAGLGCGGLGLEPGVLVGR